MKKGRSATSPSHLLVTFLCSPAIVHLHWINARNALEDPDRPNPKTHAKMSRPSYPIIHRQSISTLANLTIVRSELLRAWSCCTAGHLRVLTGFSSVMFDSGHYHASDWLVPLPINMSNNPWPILPIPTNRSENALCPPSLCRLVSPCSPLSFLSPLL